MSSVEEQIKEVLSEEQVAQFEPMEEIQSPLHQPVVEKQMDRQDESVAEDADLKQDNDFHIPEEDLDAPEQQIEDYDPSIALKEEESNFELPISHAKQAADAILGVTDNLLEVGGGYFVKIRKHKLFYEFEEIIAIIDQQNEQNVKRIKLEPEDKILLHPLLTAVLQKRAARLTPEQQLMGALISILFKKVQAAVEIRMENEILVERILEIVKEEKSGVKQTAEKDVSVKQEEQVTPPNTSPTIEDALIETA